MTTDELEAAYMAARPAGERRERGVTFTPKWLVDLMVGLVAGERQPDTLIVDAGAGAGRFTVAAAHALRTAHILAIESDPALANSLEILIRREGLAARVDVAQGNFLELVLPSERRRVFLGNPPYVRHHALTRTQKSWLGTAGAALGVRFSELAGLHIYFLARCLAEAKPGDRLVMILPSEWMETRYGIDLKAAILNRATSIKLYVFAPGVQVFEYAMTTSVILDLQFGNGVPRVSAALVDHESKCIAVKEADVVLPEEAPEAANWLHAALSAVGCGERGPVDVGETIELGELFRIHRGQVTGMNSVWIANAETAQWVPQRYLVPCVTDAKEILASKNGVLESALSLREVIDLPAELDDLDGGERKGVARFLEHAKRMGADRSYIASHRKPWWRVALREPPPIVMSYMARQSPKFAVNRCSARLLNIAHGLYPKVTLTQTQMHAIVDWLNNAGPSRIGRTYAGGLIKVEPRDAQRIRVPTPDSLAQEVGGLATMRWPKHARRWTLEEIGRDARASTDLFRERRLGEPKERYLKAFDLLEVANRSLMGSLSRLRERPVDAAWVASLLADENLRTAMRYLGAPPISEDDLKTLTGDSLAPTLVREDASRAERICDVIVKILDPKRFPWIYENRPPAREEVSRALLASTVVAAAQKVQTSRRVDEKLAIEGAVSGLLVGTGWRRIASPKNGIKNIRRDAPAAQEFMESVTLGGHGADFVVGLGDDRVLAIECEGSNSEINSRKRINKEVANNAQAGLREFGDGTLVPAAAIQGVFKPEYVSEVQEIPVVFFWGRRLEDLRAFLRVSS